jgi:K+-sensing histidine kinase KdpD
MQVIRKYVAAFAIVLMATLVVTGLTDGLPGLKLACFAASVCWSFAHLGKGPGVCALACATVATDYWILEPIYSLSMDGRTLAAMLSYLGLGLVVHRFGRSAEA